MGDKIRVLILDDHQPILDGYLFRLSSAPDIEVVAAIQDGESLEPLLAKNKVDVLLLDMQLPTSPTNQNPYPVLHIIPKLIQQYPDLSILVISMFAQRSLIRAVMDAGASGYVLKDDAASIRDLASVVRTVAHGGIHLTQAAYQQLMRRPTGGLEQPLSGRQIEVLSLCAAYPDDSTAELARHLNVASSTLRNLLSKTYLKLNVRTRAAAVVKARQAGLLPSDPPTPSL